MSNSRAIGATSFDVGSNLLLGWFFLAVGMLCNAILWHSLGMGWVAWLMALVGIGFDLAKIRLLNNAAFSFKYASYLGGAFYAAWFVVMTLLSMFAASGFFLLQITTTQQQSAINSDAYHQQQQRFDIAQKQFDANSAYAHISPSALISERDQKINTILNMQVLNSNGENAGTLANVTNNCTNKSSWYYQRYGNYCIQIESFFTEYSSKINSAETAQNALATMDNAALNKTALSNNVSIGTPIFSYTASFLVVAEQNVLLSFTAITAIITELLASILLGSAYLLSKSVRPSIDQILQVKIAEIEMRNELLALQQIPTQPAKQPTQPIPNGMPKPRQDAQPIPNGMPSQTESIFKSVVKRIKGNGDTDTSGKHSTRYHFYRESVLNGTLNPTVNAFKQAKYHGKKIGSTTAQEFLNAMVNEGLLQKGFDSNNRTIYTRVEEACYV